MPLIEFSTSESGELNSLLLATSSAVAKALGKSEEAVMVRAEVDRASFGGSTDPSCRVRVQQIGPYQDSARGELARVLTWLAAEHLGVVEERVFVLFESLPASHWAKAGHLYG